MSRPGVDSFYPCNEAPKGNAAYEGYGALEEALDRGQSGAILPRPGMDRVWDLLHPTKPFNGALY